MTQLMPGLQKNRNSGYALVEMLFYLSLFFVLSLALFNSIIAMTKSFTTTASHSDITQSLQIMERLSRDIRKANGIYTMTETDLTLKTTNNAGVDTLRRFRLHNNNVEFYENGVLIGNLNTAHVSVLNLTFTRITAPKGNAIKIFLQMQSKRDPAQSRVENYYNTVALRGGY